MAGFGHGNSDSLEPADPARDARNTRLGWWLFLAYSAVYAGFVALNAFRPDLMETTPIAGINLAILYGFGLIAGALVLSLTYGWLCQARRPERRGSGGVE